MFTERLRSVYSKVTPKAKAEAVKAQHAAGKHIGIIFTLETLKTSRFCVLINENVCLHGEQVQNVSAVAHGSA